jgi:hypothetical protein
MVFASQRLGSEHSEHTITALPHFLGGPPGEMLLKVAMLAALGHKSIGSKNDHAAGRKPLHIRQHPPAIVLLQMLDDVQGDASVKPAAREEIADLLHVARKILVMSSSPASLFQGRGVTFKTDKM